tara:strand:+ start:583 stop:861 length:279 start_codon:yes stop_codon:yes gene_type:complete
VFINELLFCVVIIFELRNLFAANGKNVNSLEEIYDYLENSLLVSQIINKNSVYLNRTRQGCSTFLKKLSSYKKCKIIILMKNFFKLIVLKKE